MTGGPLESALQPDEDTKDGQAVIKSMYLQYGGRTKWDNAHHSKMIQLNTKWNSANGTRTLPNHITPFRVAMADVIRCCKRTGWSVPTERKKAGIVVDCLDYYYKSLINRSHFDG